MGYLVCEKCGGYYELQEGESPDDFDNCQCGGRLRYFDNLDEYRSYDHDLTEYSHINEPGVDKLNPDDETLSSEEVYDETIYLTWLIGIFILTFVGVFVVQSLIVPIDAKPTFNLVFIIVILAALFTANFLILRIKITQEYLSVSFGLFKNIISWQDINNCYVNEPSTAKFRGYGIRFTKINGRRIQGYVMGNPIVIISLNKGEYGHFAFTTRNPQEVCELINKYKVS